MSLTPPLRGQLRRLVLDRSWPVPAVSHLFQCARVFIGQDQTFGACGTPAQLSLCSLVSAV